MRKFSHWAICDNSVLIHTHSYTLEFYWSMPLAQLLLWWFLGGVLVFYSFLFILNMETHKELLFEIFQMCPSQIHQQRK
jgi:hypothetical protein